MVGVAGLEPATSCSQNTRANQTALHPDYTNYTTSDRENQCQYLSCLTASQYLSYNKAKANVVLATSDSGLPAVPKVSKNGFTPILTFC